MKKTILRIMGISALVVVCLSCTKGNDTNNKSETKDKEGEQQTEQPSGKDPDGTITIRASYDSGFPGTETDLPLRYGFYWISESGNFEHRGGGGDIVCVGEARGLWELKTTDLPTRGWGTQIAGIKGNLYVFKYGNEFTPGEVEKYYYGVYIVDEYKDQYVDKNGTHTVNAIVMKYCQFDPEKGWL